PQFSKFSSQFDHACAVLSPASSQISLRRRHALNRASASGDNTTDTCSPVTSKEQSSRSEKTARGLGGPSLGSNHGRKLSQYVCSACWNMSRLLASIVARINSARNCTTRSQ